VVERVIGNDEVGSSILPSSTIPLPLLIKTRYPINMKDNYSIENIKSFKTGDHILDKGAPATEAYMILSGKVRVYIKEGSRKVELAILEHGAIFGETSIFDGESYGACVEAVEDCKLLAITPKAMNDMLDNTDPFIRGLLEMLIERLKDTNAALVKSETREYMDIALI
tara:strand:+ start:56 stop:559 length:504 start_codon:yes stop_codon:yes gene_type:complete